MLETVDERLNRLQEADLGTARREYVSTVDRDFRETRLEVIEASRRSNIPGSAEQRVALANKASLAAWTNIYKEIGDTGGLEELDNLLDGQSHRLKLSESQGGSTQSFGSAGRKNAAPMKATQRKLVHHSGSVEATGCPSSAGPSTRRPTQATSIGSKGPSGLVRALKKNTFPSKSKKSKATGKAGSSAKCAPFLKNGRPLGELSREMSSPEEFLAAARGMVSTLQSPNKSPSEVPKLQETPKEQSLAIVSKANPKWLDIILPSQKPVASNRPVLTTSTEKRKALVHEPKSDAEPKEASGTISLHTNEQLQNQERPGPEPQSLAANGEDASPTSNLSKKVGILLDFDCAAPSNCVTEPGMSPAFEELKGLEFMQFFEPKTSSSSGIANANRRLHFEGSLPTKHELCELEETESTTEYLDEELVAEYQREINTIRELLERPSLSDMFVLKMTGFKKEIESSLRLLVKDQNLQLPDSPSPEHKELESVPKSVASAAAEALSKPDTPVSQPFLTPPALETKEFESATPATVEETPKHSRNTSLSTPTSQSRLRGAAPQFQPVSFTNFRTVSSAASTNSSTSFHSTLTNAKSDTRPPVAAKEPTPESRSESIKAQFAANVHRAVSGIQEPLPGEDEKAPEKTEKPRKSHIFGDHLLPGRRVTPPALTRPDLAPYSQSVLAEAAAPKPSPTTFTLPSPPRLIKIVNSNTASRGKENAKGVPPSKINVPGLDPAQDTLCLKSSNVAAPAATTKKTQKSSEKPISMMESIYAPKPKITQASTENKKPPVSKGLMGSRYADAQWL